METKPTVSKITIYPIKSLDGIELQKGMITGGGCLLHDREYAIADSNGQFINGKANPLVHSLRSEIDFEKEMISFRLHDEVIWNQFDLQNEKAAIDTYLSNFFKTPAKFIQNKTGRFLDIPDVSGVTVVSTATLQSVSAWFNITDLDETRKRFRSTIEIKSMEPFWEDHLFSIEGMSIEFTIGEVTLYGMSPRARCVVPTRNPETGEVLHAFPKTFSKNRAASLPAWSTLDEYDHYYYLTVDCYIPGSEVGKWIYVGDEVTVIGEKELG